MFENIIEQSAVNQLRDDILGGRFAPSVLFYGPGESGKVSAALELARVLSCEKDAAWKCSCNSCRKHRYLQHDDLLVLGCRSFAAEIAAGSSVFLKNPSNQNVKLLLFRSIRKLMIRFSPVLIQDDPKLNKISPVLQSLDDRLTELMALDEKTAGQSALEKLCGSLIKDVQSLEKEGISSTIPIGHIRRASYWCRLAPESKRKTLIIENAENMRDEARNSLLKLLEEPPATVCIVLTVQRREAVIPTILSRVRPYRFLKRSAESEKEVLRRVFQSTAEEAKGTTGSLISAYLESFAPQSTEKLYPLAAWFLVSFARITAISIKKTGADTIPGFINALGEHYAQIAESSGFERTLKSASVIKTIIAKSANFEDESFSRFLKICLDMVGNVTRTAEDPQYAVYNDIFRKHIEKTVTAVDVLNINAASALEALFYNLKKEALRQV